MALISAQHLKKEYSIGRLCTNVIKDLSLTISQGEFVSIIGPSGSGKTTLLYLLSGLEKYTSGNVLIFDKELNTYSDNQISLLRQHKMGFVFQFYNLIPNLTVYENVLLATVLGNTSNKTIDKVLEMVGILPYKHYYPHQISGGTQQRVAIARALINNPEIIFVDEPIGNLDYKNGHAIMDIFKSLNQDWHKTIVLVTHNEDMIRYGTRYIRLIDGEIAQDEQVK